MKNLTDRVVILTGATSGFGAAMAETFAAEGASLVLIARNEARLTEMAARVRACGGNAEIVPGDVTERTTFARAVAVALERWGKVDILINNAGGGGAIDTVANQTAERIEQCIALNLTSVINGCSVVVPQMQRQHAGLIINLSSACAKFAWPGWSVYSAAKAGLAMFSRCLQAEVRACGIGVTVLTPGGSNTGFQQAAGVETFPWDDAESLRPEHIAHAALSIALLPPGAMVPEMVVYGMQQEIVPF